MPDLTVTLMQSDLAWEDVAANIGRFDAAIDRLETAGDLIVLPEMFSTGFSMNAARLAEPMTGQALTWLRRKAQARGAVLTGSVMIEEGGKYFNRLVWARPDGTLATYDKRHLFRYAGEEKVYTPGHGHITVECRGWRIRPFICYDLRFPLWTRNLDLAYDAALFVANWPDRRSAHWRALLVARAIENQCYVIAVNRVGRDGNGLGYDGGSMVISPTGEILTEGLFEAATPTVTLRHDLLEQYRKDFPAWMDADTDLMRRPETR